MATTSLIENFQSLAVKDDSDEIQAHAKCLPYKPGPDFGISPRKVDRYLFRLFDRHSDGSMNNAWVKSKDADKAKFQYDKDVFERENRHEAAQALRRHLQWSGKPGEEDNFVSWSSSLLLVLRYAFYRKAHFVNHKLEDMRLCIVDTAKLPDGVFLSDTVLIEAFSQYDSDPKDCKSLRSLKTLRQSRYYFGEYLSQGALYIKECCAFISMESIVSKGLFDLREEFQVAAHSPNQKWATEVLNLRQIFRSSEAERPSLVTDRELIAALNIGCTYGSIWRLPIALAFLALKPRHSWDTNLIKTCRLWCNSDHVKLQLSPEAMTVVPHQYLPEVNEFDKLRRCVYEDSVLRTILRKFKTANKELSSALQLAKSMQPRNDGRSLVSSRPHYRALDSVTLTTSELEEALAERLDREE